MSFCILPGDFGFDAASRSFNSRFQDSGSLDSTQLLLPFQLLFRVSSDTPPIRFRARVRARARVRVRVKVEVRVGVKVISSFK